MIYYLVHGEHRYTVEAMQRWRTPAAAALSGIAYERMPRARLGRGVYVAADIERLKPQLVELVAQVLEALRERGLCTLLLNHPTHSLRRYELLRALADNGRNPFDVYRVNEERRPQRFPVFIRDENEHTGSLTGLLRDRSELEATLASMDTDESMQRKPRLIVEYTEVARRGDLFRKYSAYRIGDTILPKHVLFSRQWLQKQADLVDPELVEEERQYLSSFPHEAEVREVFELAHIEFGRMDYAVHDGRVVVWEINTNPYAQPVPRQHPAARHEFALDFERKAGEALLALAAKGDARAW